MANCTCPAVLNGFFDLSQQLHVPPATLLGLLSGFASVGFLGLLAVLPYLFRICKGQDVMVQCLIRKSVLTFSYDATGNGLHTSQKMVFDMNRGGAMKMEPTGLADSQEEGLTSRSSAGGASSDSNTGVPPPLPPAAAASSIVEEDRPVPGFVRFLSAVHPEKKSKSSTPGGSAVEG